MFIQTPRNKYKIEYISKKNLTYDSLPTRLGTWQLALSIDILNLKAMNHHILNSILYEDHSLMIRITLRCKTIQINKNNLKVIISGR